MSVTVKLLKRLNKLRLEKRRGNIQLIQTAIALLITIGIGAVVFSLVMGIGSQITQNTPAPAPKSLFANLTSIFETAVSQGANLLPSIFLVGFGVIVLGAIMYIWAWFGGGRGFGR
jgi:protein-S-isoprenylcysteine O-methyltransferase Ste14